MWFSSGMMLNILHVNYFINMFSNTQIPLLFFHVGYRLENQFSKTLIKCVYQYLGFSEFQ